MYKQANRPHYLQAKPLYPGLDILKDMLFTGLFFESGLIEIVMSV